MLDRRTHPDGFGGITDTWVDGAMFDAAAAMRQSDEMTIAYRNGLKMVYDVVVPETVTLMQNDRIKRVRDGLVIRVTSNTAEMTTPSMSDMHFSQCSAEAIT